MKELNEFIRDWDNLIPGPNAFKRVDAEHPLDFYIGQSAYGSKELFLISEEEPAGLSGSKSIDVQIGKRQDGRWSITFTLIKPEHEQPFVALCYDIVESSRNVSGKGMSFVIKRFQKWQLLLAQTSDGLLSLEVQKGLFGELLFFRSCIQNGFPPAQTADAWIGCNKADKDFVFDAKWCEIKTIDPAAVAVHISSIEQLDAPNDGELVINFVENTSLQDNYGQTLNELIIDIRDLLKNNQAALAEFNVKLSIAGFQENIKYDEHKYVCRCVKYYSVDESFPRITRQDLPVSVVKLSYELGINSLSAWEIKYYRENDDGTA